MNVKLFEGAKVSGLPAQLAQCRAAEKAEVGKIATLRRLVKRCAEKQEQAIDEGRSSLYKIATERRQEYEEKCERLQGKA